MTKTAKVLNHLETKGTITSLEAIELYKATRLSAIIFTLRKRHEIETIMQESTDEDGRRIFYGVYKLKEGYKENGRKKNVYEKNN